MAFANLWVPKLWQHSTFLILTVVILAICILKITKNQEEKNMRIYQKLFLFLPLPQNLWLESAKK